MTKARSHANAVIPTSIEGSVFQLYEETSDNADEPLWYSDATPFQFLQDRMAPTKEDLWGVTEAFILRE